MLNLTNIPLFKTPKLCLFDLDGTLIHHESDYFYQNATAIYQSLGRAIPTPSVFQTMLTQQTLFADIAENERRDFQEEFWKRFEKLAWPVPREIEGTFETLERFVSAGSQIAIVTARTQLPEDVEHFLKPTGLLKHIHIISTLGEPHLLNRIHSAGLKVPQIHYVCKQLAVAPSASLIAGDSPSDITSGRQAGVAITVGLLSGNVDSQLIKDANPHILTDNMATMPKHFYW